MAITNGFDTTKILASLSGRVGWQQPTLAESPVIDADNLKSASGRYFQDFHPMVTISNLLSCIEDDGLTTDAGINAFLKQLQNTAILRALNGVFDKPQMLESTLLFDRTLRNDIVTQNFGKFCGYRFYVSPGDFSAQLSRVSLFFNADATFNLYCFNDAVKLPIYTQTVTVKANEEVFIDLTDWILNYIDTKSAGGVFYVGYFQNDLGGAKAIDQFVSQWNKSLAFGYTAMEAVSTSSTDFVRIAVPYTLRTYGMNIEVQTYKNYTNKVIKQASLFDEVIGLTMAITVLGYMAYSTRSNQKERVTEELSARIYNEIYNSGDAVQLNPYVAGLKQQMTRELEKLRDNYFNNNRVYKVLTSRAPINGVL